MGLIAKLFGRGNALGITGQPVEVYNPPVPNPVNRRDRLIARRARLNIAVVAEQAKGTPDHFINPMKEELVAIERELLNG